IKIQRLDRKGEANPTGRTKDGEAIFAPVGFEPKARIFNEQRDYKNSASRPKGRGESYRADLTFLDLVV
ncbi:MAG: hypothetical protein AAB527_02085, partial [Patescibacteria group bacterium]